MVLADGFPCNGKTFPSLSKVAFAMLRANNLIDQPPSALLDDLRALCPSQNSSGRNQSLVPACSINPMRIREIFQPLLQTDICRFESSHPSQFGPVSTVQYAGVSKPRSTG
jgi:hypothetical protein